MTPSQRRPIARRTHYGTMVALLVAISTTLSACAGRSDRDPDSSQAAAPGAKQIQAEYVPCGKPPVKLEKVDQDFLDTLAAAGGTPLYEQSYKDAREVLNKLQAGPVDMLPAQIGERTVPGGPTGPV
ncbi:lipase, partial [Streptomyces sp. NPDC005133]